MMGLDRIGVVMEPDPVDPREAEGVLNPAVARGQDGSVYLLPRLVAAGNYSRIGLARVVFDRRGVPAGVERMGVVLEPQEPYETNGQYSGVEDPRITYFSEWQLYVMTYTALGPSGARIALAISHDLAHWHRLGLARFAPHQDIDIEQLDNKDAVLFPSAVLAPDGRRSLALIHRPFCPPNQLGRISTPLPPILTLRPSMWISYIPLDAFTRFPNGRSLVWSQHHILAEPRQKWECLRIGAGTPPIRIRGGWLMLYHGVSGRFVDGPGRQRLVRYCAGVLVLDERDPRRVLYRSERSILEPRSAAERLGTGPRIVFPTGVDLRPNETLHVYYGMADTRIGVSRAYLSDLLAPFEGHAA